jgi:uncharacterized OsmC-like protein
MATQISAAKINGVDTEQLKQTMDAVSANPASGIARFQVSTAWKGNGPRSETRVTGWELGGNRIPRQFTIPIDEPPELLGTNTAPNPQEYLLAAANACMLATYVAACSMQGIELESLEIETGGELDLRGFLGLDRNVKPGYDELEYTVRIKGNGTRQQFERVHQWVMKTSPNYWNMANPIRMVPRLVVES